MRRGGQAWPELTMKLVVALQVRTLVMLSVAATPADRVAAFCCSFEMVPKIVTLPSRPIFRTRGSQPSLR